MTDFNNLDIGSLDVVSVQPYIAEAMEREMYRLAILLYINKFNRADMADRIDGLNLIVVKLDHLLDKHPDLWSDLAAIFSLEPAFKDEYQKICNKIQESIRNSQSR